MLSMAQIKNMAPYQSHKIVRAAKILSITLDKASRMVRMTVEGQQGPMQVTPDRTFLAKHQPEEGGYLVSYSDGYCSYSHSQPFESGYKLLPEGTPPQTPSPDGAAA